MTVKISENSDNDIVMTTHTFNVNPGTFSKCLNDVKFRIFLFCFVLFLCKRKSMSTVKCEWGKKNPVNYWHFLSTLRYFFSHAISLLYYLSISVLTSKTLRNGPWRFHFWISVTVTTLRNVAFIIYSNDNSFRLFFNVCECV